LIEEQLALKKITLEILEGHVRTFGERTVLICMKRKRSLKGRKSYAPKKYCFDNRSVENPRLRLGKKGKNGGLRG